MIATLLSVGGIVAIGSLPAYFGMPLLDAEVLVVPAAALVFAWFRRSIVVAVMAGLVLLWFAMCVQPWLVFDPNLYEDPHYLSLIGPLRAVFFAWMFLSVAGAACLVALVQLRRL
jgi:hypothetical protein